MIQMIKFEFQKLFQKKIVYIGILLIAGLNILMASRGNSYMVRTADKTYLSGVKAIQYDKEIAAKYAGELTDDKVQQILRDHPRPGENEIKFVAENAVYNTVAGKFAKADGTWNGILVKEAFQNYQGTLQLGYSEGWSWSIYYLSNILLCVGFLIIIVIAPVFADEYTKGMDALILTARYGKNKCVKAKIIASYLFSLAVTASIIIINVLLHLVIWGFEGSKASVQLNSLGIFWDVPYALNYAQAAGYAILIWLVSVMTLTGIVLAFSAISKSPFIALIVSLFCYSIPTFINPGSQVLQALNTLNPIRSIHLFNVFNIQKLQIFENQVMYAWVICGFMGLAVIVTSVYAKKVFSKHQVA